MKLHTFLKSYDFIGKTMTSFSTSSGIETSAADLHAFIPEAEWLESRRFAAGTGEEEVQDWLQENGLLQ